MRQYLWIGSFVPDELNEKVSQLGYRNPASRLSQKNILQGIESISNVAFDSIGCLSMIGYPTQGRLFVEDICFSHNATAKDKLVGFCNIKYFNKLSSQRNLVNNAKVWAKNHKKDDVEIFIYEMRSSCLAAAAACEKIIKNVRIHLIVPDLPQYMDLRMNPVKKILKQYDWKNIQKYLDSVDDYILYSASMAEILPINNKRWMVMEGSISLSEIEENIIADNCNSDKTTVMYSGSLQQGFGIKNLLDAMNYLDDSYELWFTGRGSAVDAINKYAENDNRIKYYGFLPTREELKQLQAKATMLINMRDPEEAASKYCFPSKLFEYMLTGKTVLTCKLGGIPEEYYDYLVEIKSLDPRDIAEAIKQASNCNESKKSCINARDFIINNKTNIVQAKRIMNFINSDTKEDR